MTAPPVPETFVPDRRPVRRFVTAIGSIALALTAVWWSGAFTPHLHIPCASRIGVASDTKVLRFELHNDGPLPVQITGVKTAEGRVVVGGTNIDGAALPDTGVALGGGQTVVVEINGVDVGATLNTPLPAANSGPLGGTPPSRPLSSTLAVRTIAGSEHSFVVETLASDRSGCSSLRWP